MKKIFLIFTIFLSFFLTSCEPAKGTIPTPEEISSEKEILSDADVMNICQKKGGHYEDWDNHDGTSTTYCIHPDGWGCEPEKLADGSCDKE